MEHNPTASATISSLTGMKKVFAPIRHWWLVFIAETKRLTAYRAQFWFELILSSIIELSVALAVWRTVFQSSGQESLNGYTFESMALYLTVAIFFGQASKGTGVGTFQREVYEGSLTKYLIYPLSVYSYKLGTFLPRSLFAIGQLTVTLAVIYLIGLWPTGRTLDPAWICGGLLSLLLACLLYFFLIICIESLSFWADNVWALSYALQIGIVFLSGKAIPLDLFPSWIQSILAASPFPYLVYFPVQVFLGQLPVATVMAGVSQLLIWVLVAFFLSKLIMRRGLLRYSGVGQ